MASLIGSAIGSRVLGGGSASRSATSELRNPTSDFGGGGLIFGKDGSVRTTTERATTVNNVVQQQARLGRQFGGLRGVLGTPGDGMLTNAIRNQSDRRSNRVLGNLRENFGRRRVLGSSFAADSLARAEAELRAQDDVSLANAALSELDAEMRLISAEGDAFIGGAQTLLDELNTLAGFTSAHGSQITGIMSEMAKARSEMFMKKAENAGALGRDIVAGFTAAAGAPSGTGIGGRILAGLGA